MAAAGQLPVPVLLEGVAPQTALVVIMNEETGQSVTFSGFSPQCGEITLTPLLVEELKASSLGETQTYSCTVLAIAANGEATVKRRTVFSSPAPGVRLPVFNYGPKDGMRTTAIGERQLIGVGRMKPRLIPARPDDVELLARIARMEEELAYYIYTYQLPDGALCTYDEEGPHVQPAFIAGQFLRFDVALANATPAQQTATSCAATCWGSQLVGTVPVTVSISFLDLGDPDVIGRSYSPTAYLTNSIWYPSPLRNQQVGYDINTGQTDIRLEMNTRFSFYYGTDTNCPAGQVDYVTIALHEMAHGLGFYDSIDSSSGTYGYGDGTKPYVYDQFLYYNGSRFSSLSAASRKAALTSNALFFDGPSAGAANGSNRVKLYAPSVYAPGSSGSHWDTTVAFSTFMKYAYYSPIHTIDACTLGLMKDLGWTQPSSTSLYDYTISGGAATITRYKGADTVVTIPSTLGDCPVTCIGANAFTGCFKLTGVALPEGIVSIGNYAFAGCRNLAAITIPDSVRSFGDRAFDNCLSLKAVVIPNSVTNIGYGAFNNSGLTSVTIPSAVTRIGPQPFSFCGSLTEITVSASNPMYSSTNGVLFNKSRYYLIQYPAGKSGKYTIPMGVTGIGPLAFAGSVGLTEVSFPRTLMSFGSLPFVKCSGLSSIVVLSNNLNFCSIDGVVFNRAKTTLVQYPVGRAGDYAIPSAVTNISYYAFQSCFQLTRLTVPDGVSRIENSQFSSCTGLISVTLGKGVSQIGDYAFASCFRLNSVFFGNGITYIGNAAFGGCSRLTGLYFTGDAPAVSSNALQSAFNSTVYYLPETSGWGATFGGRPTAPWLSSSLNVVGVNAAQLQGRPQVEITYDLMASDASAYNVTLGVSTNGGNTFFTPETGLNGHVGNVVRGTGRKITWDAFETLPPRVFNAMRVRVTAERGVTTSGASSTFLLDLRGSAVWHLAAPAGVKATMDWPVAVAVTWNAVPGASGYEVWRGDKAVVTSGKRIAAVGRELCRHVDSETPLGQVHYYWVRAFNGVTNSVFSVAVQGCRNPNAVPTVPAGVSATLNLAAEVKVRWTGVSQAACYEVFRNVENMSEQSICIGSVQATVPGTVEFSDQAAMAGVEYWYFIRSVNKLGASAFSKGIMGYAVGKAFEGIEWDTDRVKDYFGDYDPIRVVQVVDTGNTAIRTKRPFAVRAYLRTPTYQHASVTNVEMRVYEGAQLLATTVGTVFPRSAFRAWSSYSEMAQKHRLPGAASEKTYNLMMEAKDSLTALVPAERCPESGKKTLRAVVRCNGLEFGRETTVGFADETRGLTLVFVRVYDKKYGYPADHIWNDRNRMLSLVKSIYPYKEDIVVTNTVSDVMFDSDWTDTIPFGEFGKRRLSTIVGQTARSQMRDVFLDAEKRGDHIVTVGIVARVPDDDSSSGYVINNRPIVIVRGNDSSIRHSLAHELGHIEPFKLGENYDGGTDSVFNRKSETPEYRSPVGNYLLPTMGAMNVVEALYNEFSGILNPSDSISISPEERNGAVGKYTTTPHAILTIPVLKMISDDPKLRTTVMMGGTGLDWVSAEPNEYKRVCDVLLPGAWGNKSVLPASLLSMRPEEGVLSAGPSYTGQVVMATASAKEGGGFDIWPLSSLGQMEINAPETDGAFRFTTLDEQGNLLDQIGFGMSSGSGGEMGSALIPYRLESHVLRLVSSNGVVLAEKVRSPNAPACASVSCAVVSGGYQITWSVSDADGDSPLWSSLYYASEGTNYIGPIISMGTNQSAFVPTGIVPGGTGTVWKVVVSDGFNFGQGVSAPMSLDNVAPVCGFVPGCPEAVATGETYGYAGYASDREDGLIPEKDVTWYQDGIVVGTGYQAGISFSTEGWHTLEVVCRDSGGATGSGMMRVFAADTNATPVAAVREAVIVAVPGETVTLESVSTDPNGDPLTHSWEQTSGATVTFSGMTDTTAVFDMPEIGLGEALTFTLTVSDGVHTGLPVTVKVMHDVQDVTLSVPQIVFPSEGGRTSVTVRASYEGCSWTAQCTSEWVRLLSPSSSAGYGEVWIEAGANTGCGRETEVLFNDKTLIVQQNGDTDGDGMPDAWERAYGLNPDSVADAALDPDGDSLSNLAEYHAGTNPNKRDTDGDTLPDGWELVRGFSPLDTLRGMNSYAGLFITGGTAEGVALGSDHAYVADGTNGLVVLDVSVPSNIVQVGGCVLEGFANDVAVEGGRAYVTCGTNGLAVVDVSDAANPFVLSVCPLEGLSCGVCVASNVAFVASGEAGVHVVEVGESGGAALVTTFGTEEAASDLALAGSTLYVADGPGGLLAVEVGVPASPVLLGACALPGPALDVCVTGDTAYVAIGDQGLAVAEVAVPSAMVLRDVCDTPGYALGTDVGGGFAFVADGGGGIQIVGAGTGGTNVLRGSADTPGWAKSVCVRAGLAYVADGAGGLQVIQLDGIDENQNGIPDGEEAEKLGMLVADPLEDSDGDGISNWGEYLAGMNMNSRDSDGDGMSDAWEIDQLLDPVRDDSQEDFDGDGFRNGAECSADTDPRNAESLLKVDGVEFRGTSVIVHWRGGVTARHELVRATNLASNDWLVIEQHAPPTPAVGTTLDEAPPAQGFYKLRIVP